jgi:hypothetical protein
MSIFDEPLETTLNLHLFRQLLDSIDFKKLKDTEIEELKNAILDLQKQVYLKDRLIKHLLNSTPNILEVEL